MDRQLFRQKRAWVLSALAMVGLVAMSSACGESLRASANELRSRLDADVARTVDKWHPPGLSVAAVLRDGRVLSVVRGVEQFGNRAPVTATSLFCAASVTKTFVAAAVLRL